MRQENQVVNTIPDFVVFGEFNSCQSTSFFDMDVDSGIHEENPHLLDSSILAGHHQWREPLIVRGVWVTIAFCENACRDFRVSNNMQEGISLCIYVCIDLKGLPITLGSLSGCQCISHHGLVLRVVIGAT